MNITNTPSVAKFTLNEPQKNRVNDNMNTQYCIARNMVYVQLMKWKQRMYVENEDALNVAGEVWSQMDLTSGDLVFINKQVEAILLLQPDDDLLEKMAAKMYKEETLRFNESSKSLRRDLESALTINDDEGLK